MAAIDKLYIHSFEELSQLRKWALAYYPKLLLFVYDEFLTMNEQEFETMADNTVKYLRNQNRNSWNYVSSDGTLNSAIAHFKNLNYEESEAISIANLYYKDYKKTLKQLRQELKIPVMNAPFRIDKKLKWICPLGFIRTYLILQCGVHEEWYYKLFWRGKKHFCYRYLK
jgi:hypothetical protein